MKEYLPRLLENQITGAAREFPAVVLTGPRQTGKSTLLQHCFPSHSYFTLDDPMTNKMAHDDPTAFLARSERMVIDEIQYLPEILTYIKIAVDRTRELNGRFLLSGSQVFPLMAGLGESLAGRAALCELLPFSSGELPVNMATADSCFAAMFGGFFPEVAVHGADRNRFYSSYVQTYLERDIRQISSVHDLRLFQNFLELLAARVGSLLNLSELSKEVGISHASAQRWLSLLEATRIVYLLRPYLRNITKRVVKSPKVYFTDTGLLAYLLRYPDPAVLRAGPQAGAFFENLVLIELLKHKFNNNLNYELFFYRDTNQNEVDIVIDAGPAIKLIEIKLTATPRNEHLTGLLRLSADLPHTECLLLCFVEKEQPVSQNTRIIPWPQVFAHL